MMLTQLERSTVNSPALFTASTRSRKAGSNGWHCAYSSVKRLPRCSIFRTHRELDSSPELPLRKTQSKEHIEHAVANNGRIRNLTFRARLRRTFPQRRGLRIFSVLNSQLEV